LLSWREREWKAEIAISLSEVTRTLMIWMTIWKVAVRHHMEVPTGEHRTATKKKRTRIATKMRISTLEDKNE